MPEKKNHVEECLIPKSSSEKWVEKEWIEIVRQKPKENLPIKLRVFQWKEYDECMSFIDSAKIEIYAVSKEDYEFTHTNIYIVSWSEWKLMAYADNNWEILLDMSTFLEKNKINLELFKKQWWSHFIFENWFYYVIDWKWKKHKEWSEKFNFIIYERFISWKYTSTSSKND